MFLFNHKQNTKCLSLDKYHQIHLKNMEAAPDKSHFFLTRVKFFGHTIEGNSITSLKLSTDAVITI